MLKPIDDLTFRGNLTTGYRAPQAYDEDLHASLRSGTRMLIELDPKLKEERSFGYSFSGDYTYFVEDLPITISLEYFNTKLYDVFVNQETGADGMGNIIFTKTNGDGARVQGFTTELKTFFTYDIQLQAGITYQTSIYETPFIWSEGDPDVGLQSQSTKNMIRTPNLYGYLTLFAEVSENWSINLSGVYTGMMYVPHYAGGINPNGDVISEDSMIESPGFFEMNIQTSYKLFSNPDLSINLGISNVFNQFQNDFDRGANRDTDYIYGPLRPRTFSIGLKTSI